MISLARACTNFKYKDIYILNKKAELIYFNQNFKIKLYKDLVNKDYNYGRILIILPKKIGVAPLRNLIKRRVKSIFYQEMIYNLKYDFVFIAQKGIENVSFKDLKNIFLNLYNKLNKANYIDKNI